MSEQKQQVPSVGRIVHYVSHGSPNGDHPAGEHRAAIITGVYTMTVNHLEEVALDTADIAVFNPQGMYFLVAAMYDPTAQRPGSWHWPEFVPAR